jgi:TonB family protein
MLAILAISPLMMHAQVKSSAQPGSTPTLESSNVQPAAFAGIKTSDHSAVPTSVRISSGVTTPVLVYSADVNPHRILPDASGRDRSVTIGMTVDATGKPTNLKVIKSEDKFTDGGVLSAVSQYRYKPATLDGNPVPAEVTVHFTIE